MTSDLLRFIGRLSRICPDSRHFPFPAFLGGLTIKRAKRPSERFMGNQTCAPLQGEIGSRPLDHNQKPVLEANEEIDVDDKPQEPGPKP